MTDSQRTIVAADDPVFDAADTDPTISPKDDFYRFVNGGWLDANPVPPEYGAWGAAQEVHERNQFILKELLEAAAGDVDAPADSTEGKAGIYFRSGMNTDRIEELGTAPIEPWLERIRSLGSVEALRPLLADLHRIGLHAFFDIGVLPDFEDAQAHLLYVGQAGLGLPDRDYYLRDDEASQALLDRVRGSCGEDVLPPWATRLLMRRVRIRRRAQARDLPRARCPTRACRCEIST